MPTTLGTTVVRRSEPAAQNTLAPEAIYALMVAVIVLAICGLASPDGVQGARTLEWPVGIAVPP